MTSRSLSEMSADAPLPLAARLQAELERGRPAQALAECVAHIEAAPEDPDGYRHRGLLLAAAGEYPDAHQSARRACELAPDDPRGWSDYGRVHVLQGWLDDAVRCFEEAIRIDPGHADAWHNLGTALKALGRRSEAFAALKQALRLAPTRADTYFNLGNLLIDAGQFEDAVECFERAARHDPRLARARSRLAQQLSEAGKVKRAETLFRQSIGLDVDHVQGWFGLGRTLEDLGDAENALACYRQVLGRRPDHAMAIGQCLALVRADATDAAELAGQAQALLAAAGTADEARALIGYGLAKYFDRRKDWPAAAAAGRIANGARRRANGAMDRGALRQRVDRIIATCDRDFFAARRRLGLGTDQPVFIVGLPRSGTTLTEQILSSHPQMHGAGELPDLSRIAARGVAAGDDPWQAASLLDELQSRLQGHEYLAALRDGAPEARLRISDKAPLNFFQLAFAAVLFPNARVIHCRREVRDSALSIWMENFNADQRYATDFDDLAFFATEYQRLMAHWRAHLPLNMLEVHYEDTVADLETQARRIVAFLDVPWDSRCLAFHSSNRAVQTPSRWQVREPIYSRSVARWRAYAPSLPELEQAFADWR